MPPSLVKQVTKWISTNVLAHEFGLSPKEINAVKRGTATPETKRAVNAQLKQVKTTGFFKQSVKSGRQTTVKNVTELPVIKARITKAERKREKQVTSEKAKATGYTEKQVSGALEGAQAAHDRVVETTKVYLAARAQAERDYPRKKHKNETWEDYRARATKKEYKAMSDAIGDERKIEKSKPWKRLRSAEVFDWDIDEMIQDAYRRKGR